MVLGRVIVMANHRPTAVAATAAKLSTDRLHGKSAKRMLEAGANVVVIAGREIPSIADSMLNAPCMVAARKSTHDASTTENVAPQLTATRSGLGTRLKAAFNLGMLMRAPRHN